MYLINLPLSVDISSKKKFLINLNAYRNEHYISLNKAKIVFKEVINTQIKNLPIFGKVRLHYYLFPKTNRELDVNNICSVADKFFCDALVEAGKITDDNYKYIPSSTFTFGHVDKENPRVEVYLEELEPMQIILGEEEINAAVEAYVRNQINIADGQQLSFDFKAARGDHAMTATVSIGGTKPVAATAPQTAPQKLSEPTSPTVPVTGTAPTQAAPATTLTNGPTGNPSTPVEQPKAEPVKEEPSASGSIFNLKS